jgi:hypothetical protein
MDTPRRLVGKRELPPLERGAKYLEAVDKLLPQPGLRRSLDYLADRERILIWIGNNLDRLDRLLQTYLQDCHECFFPERRRQIQILAVPFDASYGVMGWCNIQSQPMTILVDLGRVAPPDWQALIAHEYVHAHLGKPGHDLEFARTLDHLCLGLGLSAPNSASEESLRYHPPCQIASDPLALWRGEGESIGKLVSK